MLERVSEFLNLSEFTQIYFERAESCAIGRIDSFACGKSLSETFFGKDIYEVFVKIANAFGEKIDYKEFRKNYYSLTTFDSMKIRNYGECCAVSKANRRKYLEKYESHENFESFFKKLQEQVTTIQDCYAPIESL